MLLNLWNEHLKKQKERREKTAFYVTDNEKCYRALYWDLKMEPYTNPPDIESQRKMSIGNSIESSIIDDFKNMGILVSQQIAVETEPIVLGIEIHGKMDALVKVNNTLIPVEIKSFYGDFQAAELDAGNPKSGYVKQLYEYLWMLNNKDKLKESTVLSLTVLGIDWACPPKFGYLLYESREDCKHWCFEVQYKDDTMMNDILTRYSRVALALKENELPECEWQYKYNLDMFRTLLDGVKEKEVQDVKKGRLSRKINELEKKHIENNKVYGDYQCLYCSYKDKCLSMQGIELGYTDQEKERIKEILDSYRRNK